MQVTLHIVLLSLQHRDLQEGAPTSIHERRLDILLNEIQFLIKVAERILTLKRGW